MVFRLAKVSALALAIAAIFSGVGVAAPLEVLLYDGSPQPGRPTALGITAFSMQEFGATPGTEAVLQLRILIQKAGTHTIKLEFPVDAGDVFVDYLTLSEGR